MDAHGKPALRTIALGEVGAFTTGVCVAGTGLDCARAMGAKPALETCIEGVQSLACSASTLPATCNGAVISN